MGIHLAAISPISALGSILLQNNLCFLDFEFLHFNEPLPILQVPVPIITFARVAVTHDLWHARLGHVGGEAACHVACFANGVEVTSSDPLSVCKSCIVGKHPCKLFHPSEVAWSAGFLDLVHADVAGPMPVWTPHGRCYFLVILDDFTHTLDLHLTMKDQALDAWESMQRCWETKFSQHVKEFQSDNGGEFINSPFISALDMAGVSHRLSVPYMHQQNGVTERIICTIEGRLLAMLHFTSLPQTYWGEAALTVAYLHNCTESRALPSGQTPYEMLHGQHPNLSHLHVWGCCAFAHIPLEMQAKLGPKSWEVLFMGYPPGVKGYRVCNIVTSQFFNSRNVIFNENLSLLHLTGDEPVLAGPVAIGDVGEDDEEETGTPVPSADATVVSCNIPTVSSPPHALTLPNAPSSTTLHPLHHLSRSQILTEAGHTFQEDLEWTKARLAWWTVLPSIETSMPLSPHSCTSDSPLSPLTPLLDTPDSIAGANDAPPLSDAVINLVIAEQVHLAIWSDTHRDLGSPDYDMGIPPATYDEAMQHSDVDQWCTAMDKEVTLLQDMKVYDLVPLPPGSHAIGSHCVLKYKSGDRKGGLVEKARFVAKGFTQIPGCDFSRTFAPVARQSSICVIAALYTKEDWELHSLYIKCAFLHGKIEEEVYIKQP